ncbi:nuclear transport factor 2 family protein [Ilumatobacter sp.]|uniref:nuclear transport factor 2 family protein n=1 Tax=Ilumatobacter sp. TaxID=1967498 RepID=UPI003C377D4E
MDPTSTIDRYLDAYGETDADRRLQLISESFTPDATLADPPLDAAGHDGLSAMFAAVQSQFPGHTFMRTSAVDEHHGAARYEWSLAGPDGTVAVIGNDFVRFGSDGKLASVVGFFGPIPTIDQ